MATMDCLKNPGILNTDCCIVKYVEFMNIKF